jgi:hypothetical protein
MVGEATVPRRLLIGRFENEPGLGPRKDSGKKKETPKPPHLACEELLVSLDSTQFVRDGMTIQPFAGSRSQPPRNVWRR